MVFVAITLCGLCGDSWWCGIFWNSSCGCGVVLGARAEGAGHKACLKHP